MARVEMTMTALGCEPRCFGCGREWERGQVMTAVLYDDGEPAGWFCASCILEWGETGKQPEPNAEVTA